MNTVEELEAAWRVASEVEKKLSRRWQELTVVAKTANEEADRAYYAWLAASENYRAAFAALMDARQTALIEPKGDA